MTAIALLTLALFGQQTGKTAPLPDRPPAPPPAVDREALQRTTKNFAWSGMLSRRQSLRRGVVHARGRKTASEPKLGRIEGEVHIFCAFDLDDGRFRFDRVEPFIETLPDAPAGSPRWTRAVRDSRYIRVPGKSVVHLKGRGRTHIESEDAPAPYAVHPFDPRCVGLLTYYQLFDEKVMTLEKAATDWMKADPDEVADEGTLHRFTWIGEKAKPFNYSNTFFIDDSKGLAPVRYELKTRVAQPKVQPWSAVRASSTATWEESGGVWVPKTWHVEDQQLPDSGGSYDLTFEWESVNQPVSPRYFTVEGLELDKGEIIVDMRLKQPIVIGSIGDDHGLTIGVEGGSASMPPMPLGSAGPVTGRLGLITLGMVALVTIAWLSLRRKAAGRVA